LTYPHQYPEDPEACKGHLKALRKRLIKESMETSPVSGGWGYRRGWPGIFTFSCLSLLPSVP
jgi:hypothetical protein